MRRQARPLGRAPKSRKFLRSDLLNIISTLHPRRTGCRLPMRFTLGPGILFDLSLLCVGRQVRPFGCKRWLNLLYSLLYQYETSGKNTQHNNSSLTAFTMATLPTLPEEQLIEEDLTKEQSTAGNLSAQQSTLEASTIEQESILVRDQSHGAADLLRVSLSLFLTL